MRDIRDRAFDFAVRAVVLFRKLSQNHDGAITIIGRQFLRSATSIGANIEEAQSAESKADFIHKYSISQKEANESLYWLRLIDKSEIIFSKILLPMINETREIIAIITSILIKSKKNR